MPIRWPRTKKGKSLLLEGILLSIALPFLLFPNLNVFGTIAAFIIVASVELVPPLLHWRRLPSSAPFNVTLMLWLLLICVSILVTADPDLTLNKASGVIIGIALWRYFSRSVERPFQWQLTLMFYGLLGAGFIGLGILSAEWIDKADILSTITGQLPNLKILLPGLGDGAAHPNQIAGTLLFYVPLLWSILLGKWQTLKHWQRLLVASLALAATAVLLLTQSRSGWLAGAGSIYILILLWAIVLSPQHRHKRTLFTASIILTILGVMAVLLIGPDRLASFWQDPAQETAIGSFGSLGFRQEVWRWTVIMLQDFSFTGIGLGSFQHVIRRLYPVMVNPTFPITHAHNVFLQTAVDFGLLGLIIYLALIGILVTMLWQTARRSPVFRPYALGFAASLIAYHIYGLGDVLDSKTNLVIWVMYGLITSLHQLTHPSQNATVT